LSISSRSDFETLTQDETYSDIVEEAMETLVIYVGENEFYNYVADYSRDLLIKVCLNMLRTTEQEYD